MYICIYIHIYSPHYIHTHTPSINHTYHSCVVYDINHTSPGWSAKALRSPAFRSPGLRRGRGGVCGPVVTASCSPTLSLVEPTFVDDIRPWYMCIVFCLFVAC